MARYGVPAALQTDNESVFTSKLWSRVLTPLGIRHRRSCVGYSWRNGVIAGVIERFFGTLKPLLRQVRPRTALAMEQVLQEFAGFYNHVRRHRSLQGRTPIEAWNGKSLADVQEQSHGAC